MFLLHTPTELRMYMTCIVLTSTCSVAPADLTTGLRSQSFTVTRDLTPGNMILRNSTFPVLVEQDGTTVTMAAARLAGAGGKVVAFNSEGYIMSCGYEVNPATALSCRLAVNSLRWAAGVNTSAANTAANTFRLAIDPGSFSGPPSNQIANNIKTAAVSMLCCLQALQVLTIAHRQVQPAPCVEANLLACVC